MTRWSSRSRNHASPTSANRRQARQSGRLRDGACSIDPEPVVRYVQPEQFPQPAHGLSPGRLQVGAGNRQSAQTPEWPQQSIATTHSFVPRIATPCFPLIVSTEQTTDAVLRCPKGSVTPPPLWANRKDESAEPQARRFSLMVLLVRNRVTQATLVLSIGSILASDCRSWAARSSINDWMVTLPLGPSCSAAHAASDSSRISGENRRGGAKFGQHRANADTWYDRGNVRDFARDRAFAERHQLQLFATPASRDRALLEHQAH